MNPSALDRTAAWLLNMNVQYLDHEGMEPESLRNREDLTQVEKVTCHPTSDLYQTLLSQTTSNFSPNTPTELSFSLLPLISHLIQCTSLLKTPPLHLIICCISPTLDTCLSLRFYETHQNCHLELFSACLWHESEVNSIYCTSIWL